MANVERDNDIPADEGLDFGVVEFVAAPPQTVAEQIALGTHKLRVWVASAIAGGFFLVNAAILIGLYRALKFDFKMLQANTAGYQRFINETVITSLLGATTVQLGAIMYLIAQFLFPKKE